MAVHVKTDRLALILIANGAIILGLLWGWTVSMAWSVLAITTSLFFASLALAFISFKIWSAYQQPLQQLTAYTQALNEGESNINLMLTTNQKSLRPLLDEINVLAKFSRRENAYNNLLNDMLSRLLEDWPFPVVLFDEDKSLLYANKNASEQLRRPLLVGSVYSDLGFVFEGFQFTHLLFEDGWHQYTMQYPHGDKRYWLYSASHIANQLSQAETTSQKDLVRVLSHELRNSLTPIASMTDTLVNQSEFNVEQAKVVLKRIRSRSEHLLSFVQSYVTLSQVPEAKFEWFDLNHLLSECNQYITDQDSITFEGEQRCYGDKSLFSQVLLNLVKNSCEAQGTKQCEMHCHFYTHEGMQVLKFTDNGPGFSNPANAMTPLYTTKSDGTGIGLALVKAILQRHQGRVDVKNGDSIGAVVIMRWPVRLN